MLSRAALRRCDDAAFSAPKILLGALVGGNMGHTFKLLSLVAFSFSTIIACSSCGGAQQVGPTPEVEPVATPTEQEAQQPLAPAARPETVQGLPEDAEAAHAAAINAFAQDFWQRIRTRNGNLVVSPASISLALGMTWGGARGPTAEQMATVLHFDGHEGDAVHGAAANMLARYNDPAREELELRVVNRLFGEQTYTFEQDFLSMVRSRYGAPLEPMDYRNAPEPSRLRINGWVAEQTRERIRDLIPPRVIDGDTRLTLVNAIYFLGKWQQPFETHATRNAPFWTSASASAQVPTMHQTGSFSFAETDGVKLLEMPYRGGDFAMVFVLPNARDGLAAVEQRLTAERLDGWLSTMQADRIEVALPKFEIDPADSLALKELLSAMGMPLAFDRQQADFTGIANPPSPADRLFISHVFHKAFIKVDEEGTEAAAATAVVMARAGSAFVPPQKTFVADHPFLFLIRDTRSGAILFLGRLVNPA